MEYEEENHYVGDGNILLYTDESYIVEKIDKIMHPYIKSSPSNKDFNKKSIELFHLLTYFNINKKNKKIKKIIPHEPGDFLVTINGNNVLYEVVTVFGDKEAKEINDLIKQLLRITDREPSVGFPKMDVHKLSKQFARVLDNKKEKQYFSEFDQSTLLLITSEHDRCGTVPWYVDKEIESCIGEFTVKTGSTIEVMNYFRSMKDGNPVTSNIETEISLYNNIFN